MATDNPNTMANSITAQDDVGIGGDVVGGHKTTADHSARVVIDQRRGPLDMHSDTNDWVAEVWEISKALKGNRLTGEEGISASVRRMSREIDRLYTIVYWLVGAVIIEPILVVVIYNIFV